MNKEKKKVSFIFTFIKIALEIKPVCSKHFDSPFLLFFLCSETSQQKVFWNVGISKIFAEILEKHQRRISFFCIVASWRATFLLQRLLRSQVGTKGFTLSPSWQLCRTVISNKHHFLVQLLYLLCRLYNWFISLWINLLGSLCAYTLKFVFPSLPKSAY